jgi:hypothetical protein
MEQIRVPLADLESLMPDLMKGKWADVKKRYPPQPPPAGA